MIATKINHLVEVSLRTSYLILSLQQTSNKRLSFLLFLAANHLLNHILSNLFNQSATNYAPISSTCAEKFLNAS